MKPAVLTTTMFGRYKLLGRIGEGGMAEVYRALMTGPEGFERELVVKRILPRLSETGDFKTMFIREAKISALLLHPNIVQIYEFGEADGAYFIAMENVQGVTLREALTTLRREQRAMPYLVAADIARQICIGLDYAHTLHGPDGQAAGDRPPGHLADQHHAGLHRHGEDPRLRDRARRLVRRGGGQEGAHQGQGQLPVARADPRAAVRRARRRVRAGRRVPRDADRAAAVPGQERHRQDAAAPGAADRAAVGDQRDDPARAGSDRDALAGDRRQRSATRRPPTWPATSSGR